MSFLLISIVLNAYILLLFRAFAIYRINNLQAIVVNYWMCVLTGMVSLGNFRIFDPEFWWQPWFPFTILLSLFLISGFNLVALSTQKIGVTVTTIASKTSLVLPVIAAVFLYGDQLFFTKVSGIALAIAAVFMTSLKKREQGNKQWSTWLIILPLAVFLISGCIEIVVNYVQMQYLNDSQNAPFLIFMFLMTAIVGSLVLLFMRVVKKQVIHHRNLIAGIALGIPNYVAFYCFILALHKSGWQSSVVIPVINIGVLLLSAIGAWLLFKEKMTKLNVAGIIVAAIAILLITAN